MYATFDVFGVAPLIMINVLDPEKHVKAELSKEYAVEGSVIFLTSASESASILS